MLPTQDFLDRAYSRYQQGDFADCRQLCGLALRIAPEDERLLHLAGLAEFALGDAAQAAMLLRQAVALAPHDPRPLRDLGLVLRELGQLDAALAALQGALLQAPDDGVVLLAAGAVLLTLGRSGEALPLLRRACELRPDDPEAAFNLGLALHRTGRAREALALLERAAADHPDRAALLTNLGVLRKQFGDLGGAVAAHRQAVALAPDNVDAHFNLAHALLASGQVAEGFREWEWRLKRGGMRVPELPAPRWDGSPLAGRRLLLTAEQGIGDMIQFLRFLPVLAARGERAVVEIHPGLEPVVAGLAGVEAVLAVGEAFPPCDLWAPLLSLPGLLEVDRDSLPGAIPYLRPPVLPALPRLDGPGRKVGLVWAGNRANVELAHRSCPLSALAPLSGVPGHAFYSLQKGEAAADLAEAGAGAWITDLDPLLLDFGHTAALIAQLDLVVSIDTSVAHLAGALGKPVWIMLSADQHDFRWSGACAWYPTARLFRVDETDGWPGLAARLAAALSEG